jgi:hypothetical protein
MSIKYAKTAAGSYHKGGHKRHYCPTHDEECQIVVVQPKKKTRYDCPQGCKLTRRQVVLR